MSVLSKEVDHLIRDKDGKWLDTSYFREEAINFTKNGYYCNDPIGSPSWIEYWEAQLEKCKHGYTVNGESITGHHYFYLNFAQIKLTEQNGNRAASKKMFFPSFWDGDYDYFWAVDIAKNGITREKLDRLKVKFELRDEHLDGGYYMIVGKGRRKGYSYKNGAICANLYNIERNSLTIISAFESKFLYPKGTMQMASDYLNFLNQHTGWKKSRDVIDRIDHKRASFKHLVNGTQIEKGYMSEIMAISFKDNPDACRGKDAQLLLMEEAGRFPILKDAFYATDDTLRDGKYVTGQMIVFGTGGDMESGTVDFADMFYDPLKYNFLPFINIWDDDARNSLCGFFHPSYLNKTGFYDDEGNSDIEAAKEHDEKEVRKRQKLGSDSSSAQKYKTENPNCPAEAFKIVSTNDFPVYELNQQLNRVERDQLYLKKGQIVDLYYDTENNKVVAKPDFSNDQIPIWFDKYNEEQKKGAPIIFEYPIVDPPKGLYKIGYDPYRQDDGSSLASIIIYKASHKFSFSRHTIVAKYTGRPKTADDVNRIAELFAELYNAEIMYENEVTHVKAYFERRKKLYLLALQPDTVISNNIKSSKVSRVYGCHMNDKLKDAGEKYIKQWLLEERDFDENGVPLLNLHFIYDPKLLKELIRYNRKGNFDDVMAFMQVMFQLQEEELGKEYGNKDDSKKVGKNLLSLLTDMYKK